MHLRIGSGGEDCGGPNQDRSKSAHLRHLEACASPQGLHLSETSAAFYARFGSRLSNDYLRRKQPCTAYPQLRTCPGDTDQLTLSAKRRRWESYRFHRWLKGGENFLTRRMRSGSRDVPILSKMLAWWVLSVVIWMPNLSAACAGVSPARRYSSVRISAVVRLNNAASAAAGVAIPSLG